ncbi:MAG: CaiB/BaiF CoA-transferase family protein, partial [Thalassobaculaceae bacterium]|nr:CaiB/BaiF CoA-transferase family protein [Thalassobaculaceae bacterium]
DFSTLLPGPMATLILAEAGAEVIKLERPGSGEDMRAYPPMVTEDSGVNFALLNRGKRSLAVDLKDPETVERVKGLIRDADVLVEQFRPGVMDRLGLGYDTLKALNPALVYCSITGFGQTGPKASLAAHDLNYMSESGILNLGADSRGDPVLPPVLVADIGGGTMPAVISILLALREAEKTGEGAYLDVAMADNLFAWGYWALGERAAGKGDPTPGGELVTGGSPRYQVYRCADGRWLACAPLEPKFWANFCRVIALPDALIDDAADSAATRAAVAEIIASKSSADWLAEFDGVDACVTLVKTVSEAAADPHFQERGLFAGSMRAGDTTMTPLPPPIAPIYRDPAGGQTFPALGDANDDLLKE